MGIHTSYLAPLEAQMSDERFNQDWEVLAHKTGYKDKREMLIDLYVTQGLSFSQIGKRLGCTGHCVGRHLVRERIERRSRGGANKTYPQTRKLFYLDQRVVMTRSFNPTARACYVSTSILYHYRHLMKGKEAA